MAGNYTYIDEEGRTVTVVDPMRLIAMELAELHGHKMDASEFDDLVAQMKEDLREPRDQDGRLPPG